MSFIYSLSAATWTGLGVDDHWSTAANWSNNTVPTATDSVIFNGTGVSDCSVDVPSGLYQFTIASLYVTSNYTGQIRQFRYLDTTGMPRYARSNIWVTGPVVLSNSPVDPLHPINVYCQGTFAHTGSLLVLGELGLYENAPSQGNIGWLGMPHIGNLSCTISGITASAVGDAEAVGMDVGDGFAWAGKSFTWSSGTLTLNGFTGLSGEGASFVISPGATLDARKAATWNNYGKIVVSSGALFRRAVVGPLLFTNENGMPLASLAPGTDPIFITLTDFTRNLNSSRTSTLETVQVTISSPITGDHESLTLVEQSPMSGTSILKVVYRNYTSLLTNTGAAIIDDHILQMQPGENLLVTYTNPHDPSEIITHAFFAPVFFGKTFTDLGTIGVPLTTTIVASPSATSFAASGLPDGLTINTATGVIGGTPTIAAAGAWSWPVLTSWPVTLSATNAAGTEARVEFLSITNPPPGYVAVISPPNATVGQPYAYAFIVTSATPIIYEATNRPPGLTMDANTGNLTGTPTVAGSFNVLFSATNAGGISYLPLRVDVGVPIPPGITSANTANGQVNSLFTFTIAGTHTPTSYSATSLPAGLTLNTSTGIISGTPTVAGTTVTTVAASNAGGAGTATLTIVVAPALPPAPVITSSTAASATVGQAFSYTIMATNTAFQFSATPLPDGLIVNFASGVISGTPTTSGSSTITLGARNAGGVGNAALTLVIAPAAPVITSLTTTSAIVGQTFSYTITATNSPTGFTATPMPSGISLDALTGVISGTPTASGSSSIALGASNAGGTGNATLSLIITPAPLMVPVISSAVTATGTVGSPFAYIITATNHPTSFAAVGLPAGLTLATTTGVISGTPTTAGVSTPSLSAINADGTGVVILTLTIASSGTVPPSSNDNSSGGCGLGSGFAALLVLFFSALTHLRLLRGTLRFHEAVVPVGNGRAVT